MLSILRIAIACACWFPSTISGEMTVETMETIEAMKKIHENSEKGNHVEETDLSPLPDYITDQSDIVKGFIFLGPAGVENTYKIIVQFNGLFETTCEQVSNVLLFNKGVFFVKQFKLKIAKKCTVVSMYVDGVAIKKHTITFEPEELPRTTCDSSARSLRVVELLNNPPGVNIYITRIGLVSKFSDLLFTAKNSTRVYLSVNYIPCSVIAQVSSRRLLTTSCNIDLEDSDHDDTKLLHVTLLGAGELQIITSSYVKNEYCNHECSYPIGDSDYVLVTCPNGYQHRLDVSVNYRNKCPGAQISYVGWFGLFLCRGSDRPATFFFFIIWIFFGYFIINISIILVLWSFRILNYFIGRTLSSFDEELGVCPICQTPYLCREKVRDHTKCSNGICAYCNKPFPISQLPKHAASCPKFESCKFACLDKSLNPDTKFKKFTNWFEMVLFYRLFTKTTYLLVLIVVFFVVISPARGEIIKDVEETEIDVITWEEFNNQGPSFIITEIDTMLDSTTVFSIESKICGRTCWNSPTECKCANEEIVEQTDLMMSNEMSLLRAEIEMDKDFNGGVENGKSDLVTDDLERKYYGVTPKPQQRIKRDVVFSDNSSGDAESLEFESPIDLTNITSPKDVSKSTKKAERRKKKEEQMVQDQLVALGNPSTNQIILKKKEDCLTCHVEDRAFIHMTTRKGDTHSNAALFSLEKVQTDWGVVSINDNMQPTYDETNINTEWVTSKIEKDKVIVKGTVIGKLNIGHNSGMTWTITNKDSNEKKKLVLFIYDAVQQYQGTSGFTTGSRYVEKWFRGVCTGDCPSKCACKTDHCHHRMFDYDRKWTCNPSWCWTINGGCSCCAVDLAKKMPKWTIVKHDLKYLGTSLIFCIKLGSEKLQCTTSMGNKQIRYSGVTITISKPYGEINHLPSIMSTVFYHPQQETVQFKTPNYFWIRDDVCEKSCTHGQVGDVVANSIGEWANSLFSTTKSEPKIIGSRFKNSQDKVGMSWVGMDIDHTCHTGSWPECNYYNLVEDIDDKIKNVNATASHLHNDFDIRYSSVVDAGIAIGVMPKRLTGMIDFTIQMNNVELRRKELKFKSLSFSVSNCKGCYGCSSGFECEGKVQVEQKGEYNIHLKSSNRLISIDQSSRTLNAIDSNTINFPIHAISLLNESTIEICIEEDNHCAKIDVKLEEPERKLLKRETVITIKSNDDLNQSKCTGFGWISCAWKGTKTFFSNILDWVTYLFSNFTTIVSIILPIIFILLGILVVYKIYKMIKSKKAHKHKKPKDARSMLEDFKKEEKEKLDWANKSSLDKLKTSFKMSPPHNSN